MTLAGFLKLAAAVPTMAVTGSTALPEGHAGVGCTVDGERPRSKPGRAPTALRRGRAGPVALRSFK
jgi:hypothetical protein